MAYDFYAGEITDHPLRRQAAVDRFLINLNFRPEVPHAIARKTYYGMYNISRFDLSFEIRCTENFYGQNCDHYYCGENHGNKISVNSLSNQTIGGCCNCDMETKDTIKLSNINKFVHIFCLISWSCMK